jgi:hypothetical protein
MKNEDGKNLLPRGPKMLPGKTQAGRPAPVGGKNVDLDFNRGGSRPNPGGAVRLPAPVGGKGSPNPGRIAKLPAPVGGKGRPSTSSAEERISSLRTGKGQLAQSLSDAVNAKKLTLKKEMMRRNRRNG